MNKEKYETVFQHITGLAQKHALGKIDHSVMHAGLKKLLEELISAAVTQSAKSTRRKAFGWGFLTGAGFLAALAYTGFVLWEKGWLKGFRF